MPRVKRGNSRTNKRRKILSRAKGFRGTKSKLYRSAKESVDKALQYAYVGRKRKKRDLEGSGSCASTPLRAYTE